MQRPIKFRAWYDGNMGESFNPLDAQFLSSGGAFSQDAIFMQFTGHQTINNKELYEGDIVFVEETENDGDKRYYLVIVWIPEWSMFASLHLDEYQKFLSEGSKALDEVMFWTYTLESAETDFHYAGNIFHNQELIEK